MRLRDEDENGVDARETVPGLHDQRVQELESTIVDGSGHATFVTKNCATQCRDTVISETMKPSFVSSAWIRGAPQPSCSIVPTR